MRTLFICLGMLLVMPLMPSAFAIDDKVKAALEDESRPERDQERDRNRRPLETLQFFQMTDDMRVVELFPGGGWYTRVLAPVLRDNGKLYLAFGSNRIKDTVLKEDGFEKVSVLDIEAEFDGDGPFRTNNLSAFVMPERNLDMALTFRNMHNFTPQGRANVNKAVFDSLKRGGLYGVVDHTQRHMEPMTAESRRRIDPVVVIKEVLDAGFELVDFSDLHYKPDDELRYEVGRKSVTGNTDRFTFLFRKP